MPELKCRIVEERCPIHLSWLRMIIHFHRRDEHAMLRPQLFVLLAIDSVLHIIELGGSDALW